MTTPQALAFAVVAGMMALFIWGRFRYDVVATLSLVVAVAVGIVSPKEAFSGFSDDIVVIVASALLVSAAVARSGAVEIAMRWIAPWASTPQRQVLSLVLAVTVLSAFVKNIGALAMMMPVAFQLARRTSTSPSYLLMPMAFGALLGGIVTLVGTSPNIIVARVRAEMTGEPFGMFDFTPVGLGIAACGVLFLAFGYRLLPGGRRGTASLDAALDIKDYTTEARVTEESALAGKTVAELKQLADEVAVTGIVRGEREGSDHGKAPLPDVTLRQGDVVLLQGEPEALERSVARAGLQLTREHAEPEVEDATEEVGVVEAVIGPDSVLIGQSAGRVALYDRYGVNLLAVSRRGERLTVRLRSMTLRAGDLLVLQGGLHHMPEKLKELGCLPLAERRLQLGSARRASLTLGILGVTIGLVAFGIVPVAIAFFSAAVLLILFGALPVREAYGAIEWPILVMLGALIPVSEAVRTTGGTDLIAAWLSHLAGMLPAWGAVGLIMVAAMAVTPFLNNAATVLVMAPIAASFASQLGYRPDAFLMATAIGAACDFLTPIGHQCNTLVMGPGGYKFGDYWRLGLPLSTIVLVVGVPLVLVFWPLR